MYPTLNTLEIQQVWRSAPHLLSLAQYGIHVNIHAEHAGLTTR